MELRKTIFDWCSARVYCVCVNVSLGRDWLCMDMSYPLIPRMCECVCVVACIWVQKNILVPVRVWVCVTVCL